MDPSGEKFITERSISATGTLDVSCHTAVQVPNDVVDDSISEVSLKVVTASTNTIEYDQPKLPTNNDVDVDIEADVNSTTVVESNPLIRMLLEQSSETNSTSNVVRYNDDDDNTKDSGGVVNSTSRKTDEITTDYLIDDTPKLSPIVNNELLINTMIVSASESDEIQKGYYFVGQRNMVMNDNNNYTTSSTRQQQQQLDPSGIMMIHTDSNHVNDVRIQVPASVITKSSVDEMKKEQSLSLLSSSSSTVISGNHYYNNNDTNMSNSNSNSFSQDKVNSIESISKLTTFRTVTDNSVEKEERQFGNDQDQINHQYDQSYAWGTELQEHSRLSLAGQDSTLPLAVDNERFFMMPMITSTTTTNTNNNNNSNNNNDDDTGYRNLLLDVLKRIKVIRNDTSQWSEGNDEIGTRFYWFGVLWRMIFRIVLCNTADRINRLLITRNAGHSLQEHLSFLTSYEAFVLGGVIKEFDSDKIPNYHLRLALKNKNTCRILLQQVLQYHRWSFFYHLSTGMLYSRSFTWLSQFFNFFAFPITENDSPHSNDTWIQKLYRFFIVTIWYEFITTIPLVRYIFCGIVKDYNQRLYQERASINLATEIHGIESYNIERFGTTYGRLHTIQFRQEHRLDIDEGIVRSFMSNAIGTMIHNGIEHVLRAVTQHWKNMLYQENGNFAHQRFEQLSPFDMLRVHIPEVLCTLAGNRGRNNWDMQVLGPFVRKLQSLDPGRIVIRKGGTIVASTTGTDIENRHFVSTGEFTDPVVASSGAGAAVHPNDDYSEITAPCRAAQDLIIRLKEEIVPNVTGTITSRMDPFNEWLDAIYDSFNVLAKEAIAVRDFVATIDLGIKIGYEILRIINWHVPSDDVLRYAIVNCILGPNCNNHRKNGRMNKKLLNEANEVPREVIISALAKLSSKDERTLRELVRFECTNVTNDKTCNIGNRVGHTTTRLLLNRTKTLLQRELRRKFLDDRIRDLSKGSAIDVTTTNLKRNNWYWINNNNDGWFVVTYSGIVQSSRNLTNCDNDYRLKFLCSVTGINYIYRQSDLQVLQYIPVAEAISRAQKVFMTIELDHGKRFSYNTFMEFGSTASDSSLRNRLRRLATISQIQCTELDRARMNVLTETKNSVHNPRKKRDTEFSFGRTRLIQEARPQNAIFLGGGPTGLFGAIHCLHNTILTGGEVKIYEARDAFDQEGSSFERAHIVRLDARLVAMMRYHLGTGFEDVFVAAKGESFSHLGNSLSAQGFVEVTIKRLESMLLDEVINLRSKGLLSYFSDSPITCDEETRTFEKIGRSLKIGDLIYIDQEKGESNSVCDFIYEKHLTAVDLVVGQDYDIVQPREKRVRCYRLVRMEQDFDWYQFSSFEPGIRDVSGSFRQLPPIFSRGSGRTDPTAVIFENADGLRTKMDFDAIKEKSFRLDVSKSHVIVSWGKPGKSKMHFSVTTEEPHAIMCIEGVKVSKGMHSFGEKRFGEGLLDDYCSIETHNTRVVGDFMKSLRIDSVVQTMATKLSNNDIWKQLFDTLAASLNEKIPAILSLLQSEMVVLTQIPFKRKRVQLRFFELGNNYYLGMELPREYDMWRKSAAIMIAPEKCDTTPAPLRLTRKNLQFAIEGHIDRLWYESVLDVLKLSDVYEKGGQRRIPHFYTSDSPFEQQLGELDEMECFRLFRRTYRVCMHEANDWTLIALQHENSQFRIPSKAHVLDKSVMSKRRLEELGRDDLFEPIDTFEVLSKEKLFSIVRTSGGYVAKMPHHIRVGRTSDLSRSPDGYSESKVSLASFPVRHYVCHRALRLNRVYGKGGEDGFVTANIGDSQASPHFMRYSGLTGAGINIMSLNNLIGQALRGITVEDRMQRYAFETNWSSGEVVKRGTGSSYGQDGFLRPGFNYIDVVDYLYDKVVELFEIGTQEHAVLSRDWKVRMAAGLVPRGLENDSLFFDSVISQMETAIQNKFQAESKALAGRSKISPDLWKIIFEEKSKIKLSNLPRKSALISCSVASTYVKCRDDECFETQIRAISAASQLVLLVLKEIIECAIHQRLGNQRISSELYNQPKAVDTFIDDYTGESQVITDTLCCVIVLASTASCIYVDGNVVLVSLSLLMTLYIFFLSYKVFFAAVRYRTRHGYHVRFFIEQKLSNTLKTLFSSMTPEQRDVSTNTDPFQSSLEHSVQKFIRNAKFFGALDSDIQELQESYDSYRSMDKGEHRVIVFIRHLIENFIADKFHANSYLQEDLVRIYKELLDIRNLCRSGDSKGTIGAAEAFSLLCSSTPHLKAKYMAQQWRGETIVSACRFLFGSMMGRGQMTNKFNKIMHLVDSLPPTSSEGSAVSRSGQDLFQLNQAMREFDYASAVIIFAVVSIFFSLYASAVIIVDLTFLSDQELLVILRTVAMWVAAFVNLGFLAVAPCLFSRFIHLLEILSRLSHMRAKHPIATKLHFITILHLVTSILQLVAIATALASLLWRVLKSFDKDMDFEWFRISTVSFMSLLCSMGIVQLNNYLVLFDLDTRLGQTICTVFRETINQIERRYNRPRTGLEMETKQELDRIKWEYVARDFLHQVRFDVILDTNRVGSIFQSLQSGLRD